MSLKEKLLDLFFPPRCAFCRRTGVHGVCADCERTLPYAKVQLCEGAGFGSCASPLLYEDAVRESLLRFKFHGAQSAAERRGNVLGVYEAENTDRIRGAKILLIDDILTTGATLGECVRVLREAGAADVVCATLARAVTEKEKDGARRGTPV